MYAKFSPGGLIRHRKKCQAVWENLVRCGRLVASLLTLGVLHLRPADPAVLVFDARFEEYHRDFVPVLELDGRRLCRTSFYSDARTLPAVLSVMLPVEGG